eukprot:GSA120T00024868001.1
MIFLLLSCNYCAHMYCVWRASHLGALLPWRLPGRAADDSGFVHARGLSRALLCSTAKNSVVQQKSATSVAAPCLAQLSVARRSAQGVAPSVFFPEDFSPRGRYCSARHLLSLRPALRFGWAGYRGPGRRPVAWPSSRGAMGGLRLGNFVAGLLVAPCDGDAPARAPASAWCLVNEWQARSACNLCFTSRSVALRTVTLKTAAAAG